MNVRTPIALITGTLGSGKTTLVKRLIAGADRKLAVLMNEFGEIGIDSKIIKGEHTRIIELAGGCVCCELTGEFVAAVNELIDKYQPDLIVLEATGVAEADALVYEVEEELERARLDSVICIVDGYTSIRYPQVGYVGRVQLQQADIVLINKRDLITEEEIATVTAQIRRFNETAAVMATERCVGVEKLWVALANRPAGARPQAAASRQHTEETELQSFTYSTTRGMNKAAFERWADSLPLQVYRAKGFVVLDSTGYLFNAVAGRWELEKFPVETGQLVFIGQRIKAEQDRIIEGLQQCERENGTYIL